MFVYLLMLVVWLALVGSGGKFLLLLLQMFIRLNGWLFVYLFYFYFIFVYFSEDVDDGDDDDDDDDRRTLIKITI